MQKLKELQTHNLLGPFRQKLYMPQVSKDNHCTVGIVIEADSEQSHQQGLHYSMYSLFQEGREKCNHFFKSNSSKIL